jgi:DNA-binding NarL/FixJ family response regulator
MISVALADDEPLVRMGLRFLIDREPDLCCVGEASDGPSAVALVEKQRPDVLLLDIRMPGMDGLQVLQAITGPSAQPHLEPLSTKVIVVTTFEGDEYVFAALEAGASGFVLKDTAPAELTRAIRVVAEGQALLSPSVTRTLLSRLGRQGLGQSAPVPGMDDITPREREIMAWVATGLSNDEIASRLFLSSATVRTHVGRAMTKVGARDRAQLVVFALRAGIEPASVVGEAP